jgi:hypothetical protein
VSVIDMDASRDAVAQLNTLATDLASRGFRTRVTRNGGVLRLSVTNATAPTSHDTVTAAPAGDGSWWFWWSWGDRIARVADVEAAAFKIAYVLTPQPGD